MSRGSPGPGTGLVLGAALVLAAAGGLSAQESAEDAAGDTVGEQPAVPAPDPGAWARIGEPTPNPFRDAVRIPFRVGEAAFDPDSGVATAGRSGERWVAVTVTIYNLLHQRLDWARLVAPGSSRRGRLRELPVSGPGVYVARWDGRDSTDVRVPAGPYFAVLEVAGDEHVRKLLRLPSAEDGRQSRW